MQAIPYNTGLRPLCAADRRALLLTAIVVAVAAALMPGGATAFRSLVVAPAASPAAALVLGAGFFGIQAVVLGWAMRSAGALIRLPLVRLGRGRWDGDTTLALVRAMSGLGLLAFLSSSGVLGWAVEHQFGLDGGYMEGVVQPALARLQEANASAAAGDNSIRIFAAQIQMLLALLVPAALIGGISHAVVAAGGEVFGDLVGRHLCELPVTVDALRFTQSGGIAGGRRTVAIRRGDVTEAERQALDRMVFGSNFFAAPSGSPPPASVCDATTCQLSITAAGRTHTVTWFLGAPPGVDEIVRWMLEHSPRQSASSI